MNVLNKMKDLKEVLKMFEILNAPYFCEYSKLKEYFRKEIKKHHPDTKGDEEKAKIIISSFKELEKIYKDKDLLDYYKTTFYSNLDKNKEINQNSYKVVPEKISPSLLRKVSSPTIALLSLIAMLIISRDILISLLATSVILISLWAYNRI